MESLDFHVRILDGYHTEVHIYVNVQYTLLIPPSGVEMIQHSLRPLTGATGISGMVRLPGWIWSHTETATGENQRQWHAMAADSHYPLIFDDF